MKDKFLNTFYSHQFRPSNPDFQRQMPSVGLFGPLKRLKPGSEEQRQGSDGHRGPGGAGGGDHRGWAALAIAHEAAAALRAAADAAVHLAFKGSSKERSIHFIIMIYYIYLLDLHILHLPSIVYLAFQS